MSISQSLDKHKPFYKGRTSVYMEGTEHFSDNFTIILKFESQVWIPRAKEFFYFMFVNTLEQKVAHCSRKFQIRNKKDTLAKKKKPPSLLYTHVKYI